MHAEGVQLRDRPAVLVPDLIEPADKWRERSGLIPVTRPELVLLGVEILLAALSQGCGLVELVAAVHSPGGAGDRGQTGGHRERGWAAVLPRRVQDVGRVYPEVGPEPVDHFCLRQFSQILGELPGAVAPREVRVRL